MTKAPAKRAAPKKAKAKARKPQPRVNGQFKRVSITAEEAFVEYVNLGKTGTLHQLAEQMKGKEQTASLGLLRKWCANNLWIEKRRRLYNGLGIDDTVDNVVVLPIIKQSLKGFQEMHTVDMLQGMLGKTLVQMAGAMAKIEASTPAEMKTLIECYAAVDEIYGKLRVHLIQVQGEKDAVAQRNKKADDDTKVVPIKEDIPRIGSFGSQVVEGGKGGG